jgi:hypothetical protein
METNLTRDQVYQGLLAYYFKRYEQLLFERNLPSLSEDVKEQLDNHYNGFIFNVLIDPEHSPAAVWTFELLGKAYLIIEDAIQNDIRTKLNKVGGDNAKLA